jgi:hypothetical protein
MKQIVFSGIPMEGYFIERDGDQAIIYSSKVGYRRMSIPKKGKSNYPKIKFRVNGKSISADIHRVIAENLIKFPRPKSISPESWKNMPDDVKDHIKSLYFVNHIDHDKYNCNLSNLEWVTSKQNRHAYIKHQNSGAVLYGL